MHSEKVRKSITKPLIWWAELSMTWESLQYELKSNQVTKLGDVGIDLSKLNLNRGYHVVEFDPFNSTYLRSWSKLYQIKYTRTARNCVQLALKVLPPNAVQSTSTDNIARYHRQNTVTNIAIQTMCHLYSRILELFFELPIEPIEETRYWSLLRIQQSEILLDLVNVSTFYILI